MAEGISGLRHHEAPSPPVPGERVGVRGMKTAKSKFRKSPELIKKSNRTTRKFFTQSRCKINYQTASRFSFLIFF